MEPPGPDLPDDPGSIEALGPLRLTAALAAGAMAISSTGSAILLGGLLVAVVRRPAAAIAVAAALLAVAVRWGSASLSGLAGGQAVLGPAGLVGPPAAAASAWLAAAALVLAVPSARWHRGSPTRGSGDADDAASGPGDRRRTRPLVAPGRAAAAADEAPATGPAPWRSAPPRPPAAAVVVAVVLGATAAGVVAGPSAAGDPVLRLAGTAVGVALALGATALRPRRLVTAAAAITGVAAIGAAAVAVSGSGLV